MGRLNKPAQEGYKYRSPGQTNAKDSTPNLQEDVLASQGADYDRIGKGLNPTAERAYNRRMQQEAGGRALMRSTGRAGAVAAATDLGLAIGDEINRRHPEIGKAIVEKSGLGDAVERYVRRGHEGVKLTPEARERVLTGEADGKKKGGKVSSASKRADGAAKRGKTKGKMY